MATIAEVVKQYTPLVTMTGHGQQDRANADAVYAFIQHRLDSAGYLPDAISLMRIEDVVANLGLTKQDIFAAVNSHDARKQQAHVEYERQQAARILRRIEKAQTNAEKITIIAALIHSPLYIGS